MKGLCGSQQGHVNLEACGVVQLYTSFLRDFTHSLW